MLTAERLRELLSYNPETGEFTWRVGQRAGKVAGSIKGRWGYILVKIDQRTYRTHRVAWLYVTGSWPVDQIDHINGVRNDNRFSNLREATHAQNSCNRAARQRELPRGVYRGDRPGTYKAKINKIFLGSFATPEEAHAAYAKAALEHHGEFARMT
jgi:hypothetical protein